LMKDVFALTNEVKAFDRHCEGLLYLENWRLNDSLSYLAQAPSAAFCSCCIA
jgi:hypothetical protein